MYPGDHARVNPEKIAAILAAGAAAGSSVTYGELDERSSRLAQVLRDAGIGQGGHIVLFMENDVRYFEVCWAAMRSGLYLTPINSHLRAAEVAYILDDCGAEGLITTGTLAPTAIEALSMMEKSNRVRIRLAAYTSDDETQGFGNYEEIVNNSSRLEPSEERLGELMLYSSGVTGRPKGIVRPLRDAPASEGLAISSLMRAHYGMDVDTIYLSTAPLYHAAPLGFCLGVQTIGGTVVVMEHFDAEDSLRYIEQYSVTHSQWVPTMFIRLLRLHDDVKRSYRLDTHKVAIHAAAPCPPEVKERMMDWWGPMLYEYYGGSEFNGFTNIPPQEWLTHRGSVGRASFGEIHILDDDGNDLPPGEIGVIHFAHGGAFEYHNDPDQTASSRSSQGWTTIGDVGYLDSEGYLYLTDRKADMVISGGVNIYPKEAEDVLIMHPLVDDVAVLGVPDDELGEVLKAVVTLRKDCGTGVATSGDTAVDANAEEATRTATPPPPADIKQELIDWCGQHLARYKCPRSVDIVDTLPRSPTGKLYKRLLGEQYWAGRARKI